jgi:NhaP-type Na+/H+ or K+/H+ antiporter
MSTDVVLIVVGAAVLGLGLPSTLIKRVWLSVPLLAMGAGLLLGPEALGVVRVNVLGDEHKILEELARITLSASLVSTGLQFQRKDLSANWTRGGALLTLGMVGMWLATSLGAWLLLDVEPWIALLIGAILTPTDPVVASSLVTGRLAEANLPRWLRRSLQLEAGANDGLALVFVLVSALVLTLPTDDARTIAGQVLTQLAIALAGGLVIGYVTAKLVDFAEDHQAASAGFFLVSALALAILTLGAVHAFGGTGVLASFVAGVTFSLALGERYAEELEKMQSALEHLLLVPVFLFFGAVLPWDAWSTLGWSGVAFALWALVVRRPAVVALALTATRTPRRGVAFLSWYGPLGVAAIYYVLFVERYALEEFEVMFAAATLAIAVSVVAFSITATPGVRGYAARSPFTTLRYPLRKDIDGAP